MRAVDISGQKFGRLTAKNATQKRAGGCVVWICECICGNTVMTTPQHLKSGNTKSCGCLNLDRIMERNTKHGANKSGNVVHPLYKIWHNMKQRCQNPRNKHFKNYRARGIVVCKEWNLSYIPFRDYMLSLHNCPDNVEIPGASVDRTIERINNNEGYKPGNIRWATREEQNNNKRNTHYVTINKQRMPLTKAVLQYGKASYTVIKSRLALGWTVRDAFLTPERNI